MVVSQIRPAAVLALLCALLVSSTGLALASSPRVSSGAIPAASSTPNWTLANAAGGPSARVGAAQAYDYIAQETVLFGGESFNGTATFFDGDTWTFARGRWTQQHPAVSPSPRWEAAISYDPLSQSVILIGGFDAFGPEPDMWSWDGTNWTELSPPSVPPGRSAAGMTWSPADNALILFGGEDFSGNPLSDTWLYNGLTWTQQSPQTVPPARAFSAMDYDAQDGYVLMFGGSQFNNVSFLGDTWAWITPNWYLKPAKTSPAPRAGEALSTYSYDANGERTILFGGVTYVGSTKTANNETWVWNGHTWTQVFPTTSPSPRWGAGFDWDPTNHLYLLFGGYDFVNYLSDTWILK
jgi:hypothetical protein